MTATSVMCMAAAFVRWGAPSSFTGSSGHLVLPSSWCLGGSAWRHEVRVEIRQHAGGRGMGAAAFVVGSSDEAARANITRGHVGRGQDARPKSRTTPPPAMASVAAKRKGDRGAGRRDLHRSPSKKGVSSFRPRRAPCAVPATRARPHAVDHPARRRYPRARHRRTLAAARANVRPSRGPPAA